MRLIMEQVTGFEPVSSAWQAEILTIILYLHIWSRQQESNLQPTDYKSVALPIAPYRHIQKLVLSHHVPYFICANHIEGRHILPPTIGFLHLPKVPIDSSHRDCLY